MSCGDIDLQCAKCRLSKKRAQVVPGVGPCSSRIVFIGEGPGKDEDTKGQPFVGRAGKVLDEALKSAGVDRSRVFITNLVKCRPPGNRRPRKDEIRTCSVYLKSELETIGPKVICALGQTVGNGLLGNREKMPVLIKGDWTVPVAGRPVKLIVAYHPAACLYQRKNTKAFRESVAKALEAAGAVRGKLHH
jgi:uracil-DNA glycosylase family 4